MYLSQRREQEKNTKINHEADCIELIRTDVAFNVDIYIGCHRFRSTSLVSQKISMKLKKRISNSKRTVDRSDCQRKERNFVRNQ